MHKLCRIALDQSERIFEKIDLYVQKVVEKLSSEVVILFGSSARGDMNGGSDVDILVIADFKEAFLERIKFLLQLNENLQLLLEPVGYTPAESQKCRPGVIVS